VGLDVTIQQQGPEYNDFYPYGVNAILKFPGQGFFSFGSRTLDQTGDGFGQWNVQYVFCIAKRIIRQSTRFVNFSYNETGTRQAIVRLLTALFREWRTAKILAGSTDNQAFYIICDDSNNTPLVIASGKLLCRIGLAVNRPVEFQDYTLELDTRAINQQLSQQAATGSSSASA
jgi:phage tail sheath protein FI